MPPQREWFEKDYYQVLGVSSTATEKEITRAYRKLAKQYHPDTNAGSEERFKEISAAYDVLGDASRRKEYDEVRRLGPMAGGFGRRGAGAGAPGAGGNFRFEDLGDLGDLFGGIFGARQGRRRAGGPQRGADVETELHLSFADAVHGVTVSVNVPEDARCHTCSGSGAAPGTTSHSCSRCGGRGTLEDNQGLFSLSTVCPQCGGRGTVVDTPCSTCHGTGTERRQRTVKVRIPPGVEDHQRIRVKGRGAPGKANAPAGDLFVVVRVARDARFGRRGRNLTTSVAVSYPDAVLGSTVSVPTLDGPVTLRVPPGTAPGTQLRVKGRGVPAAGGRNGKAPGDLLVRVEVVVPKTLSEDQRAAVERLAETLGASSGGGSSSGGGTSSSGGTSSGGGTSSSGGASSGGGSSSRAATGHAGAGTAQDRGSTAADATAGSGTGTTAGSGTGTTAGSGTGTTAGSGTGTTAGAGAGPADSGSGESGPVGR